MTYILDPAESSKKMKKTNYPCLLLGILMEFLFDKKIDKLIWSPILLKSPTSSNSSALRHEYLINNS